MSISPMTDYELRAWEKFCAEETEEDCPRCGDELCVCGDCTSAETLCRKCSRAGRVAGSVRCAECAS